MAKPTRDDLVAGRYRLLEQLGVGGMGEVWKAQDTRFESRVVAVKILRDDETLLEDARNKQRFLRAVDAGARAGDLTLTFIVNSLDDLLISGRARDTLRDRIAAALGDAPIERAAAAKLFDALADDPTFNENARMRAKLRKLFRDEANSVANLRHENIVSISDYGDHAGVPYLAMDYIEGQTLLRIIQRGERMPRTRQLRLMEDLCDGLGYAHRNNLVHRDIKPANLIVDASTGRLKVLDFGVVRRLEQSGESTVGIAVGTFCYMSPEQTRGSAALDHRSDIFAVGAVFYELLSGRKAFPPGGSAIELVHNIQTKPAQPLLELVGDLQPEIAGIIDRAMAKEPEQRYADLALMKRQIERIRARLELLEEQNERTVLTVERDVTVMVDRSKETPVLDLLRRAERAFDSGDDHAVVELCDQVFLLKTTHAAASSLRAQALQRRELKEAAERERRAAEEQARIAEDETRAAAVAAGLAEEEARRVEEARKAEEARIAEEAREAEEARKADAALKAEQQRKADEKARRVAEESARKAAADEARRVAEAQALQKVEEDEQRAREEQAKRETDERERLAAEAETRRKAGEARRIADEKAREAAEQEARQVAEAKARKEAKEKARLEKAQREKAEHQEKARLAAEEQARLAVQGLLPKSPLPRYVGLATAALVVAGVTIYLLLPGALPQPSGGTDQTAAAVTTTIPATTTVPPPPPTGPPDNVLVPAPQLVSVDILPWARVRIVPVVAGVNVPGELLITPFTVQLPPGDYRLECENGGVSTRSVFPIKVEAGRPLTVTRTMSGFNADQVVGTLLGDQR